MSEEFIEKISCKLHDRTGDNETVKWGRQKSAYRNSVRKSVRNVLLSMMSLGYSPVHFDKMWVWRDISTAPKDGSNVLSWNEYLGEFHVVQWSEEESAWANGTWVYTIQPTHWMPIDPPKPIDAGK